MKEAKRTHNVGWQKMLKKRLTKYRSHYDESTLPSFQEFFSEAQYDRYSNNPDWDPEYPSTSGSAFGPKPGEEKYWPDKKKKTSPTKTSGTNKDQMLDTEDDLDVEGDPVGSFQSIASPQPEEDLSDSMMFVSNADLEKIYHANVNTFESLFKDSEGATEEPEGIVFRYLAPQIRQKIEQKINSIIVKEDSLTEAKKMKNTCWKGFEPIGTKKKNGKEVPNCVPKKK